MKRIPLNNQQVVSQKVIDLENQISIKIIRDGEKYGFQFLKNVFDKEIDPFFNSKLNWFFGYYHSISQVEQIAEDYYFQNLSLSLVKTI